MLLFRFIAPRLPLQKIPSERGKMEQKSSDFWTKFQKQKISTALAEADVSNMPGGERGIKAVSELFSSFLFSDLLHHRQIFVWTREKRRSKSKNVPKFSPKHLVREGEVLLP